MTETTNTDKPRMTLEQARAVYWLRNYHRPMGELLDEGYLTEGRLEWAAQRAYNPKLRQAAAVLLAWCRQSTPVEPEQAEQLPELDVGITVEQARATTWPFRPFKGRPMGALLDSQQLDAKDLGYAIENAWDERVRQAAIVLMALRLEQAIAEPKPAAGPLRVISVTQSYAQRKQLQLATLRGGILGAYLCLLLLALLDLTIGGKASRLGESASRMLATPAGVVALIIVLLLAGGFLGFMIWDLRRDLREVEKEIENYQKGQEGEDRVVERMRRSLDETWTLVRNVDLPGYRADIDLVLIGPFGVWALEVKALEGIYRNVGEQWEFWSSNRWKPLKRNPSRQAKRNAGRLASFLRADGIKQWVEPAVVWANPGSRLSVENPMVAVWTLDRLPEELGNLWRSQEMEEAARRRTIEKLISLCQKQGRGIIGAAPRVEDQEDNA